MAQVKFYLTTTPKGFQIIEFIIDGSGLTSINELPKVKLPEEIDWRKGIIIFGKGPIWLYAYLTHLCHVSKWVATFDPRLGGVVVQTHDSASFKVGDIIPSEDIVPFIKPHDSELTNGKVSVKEQYKGKVIAFLGPPHSGKSVLMNALRLKLREVIPAEKYQREFFIIRATPDGEGDWFADIPTTEAMTLRFKSRFDEEFTTQICSHLELLRKQKTILFADCGGRIDKKNQRIWNLCTHAIIVCARTEDFSLWKGAATASDLQVLAEIESSLESCCVVKNIQPLQLKIGKLERGNVNIDCSEQLIKKIIS